MSPHIRGIAFDLGGVLFEDGTQVLLREFREAEGDRLREILRSPNARALRSGTMPEQEFWGWCTNALTEAKIAMTAEDLRARWYAAYRVDPTMHALLRRLAGRYFCIAFSGNVKSRIQYLDAKHPFRQHFDLELYSFEAGCTKPEPAFVSFLLQHIEAHGLAACELAYIDDKESALEPAREHGVHTVLHRTGQTLETHSKLRSLGIDI